MGTLACQNMTYNSRTFFCIDIIAYEMASENVIAIIGPDTSQDSLAMSPVCAGLHLPHILPLATDPTINLQDNPYTLRVCVIVLYCVVLYCIVLYCIVLYCIVLYCIVLYCIVLYCIVSYRIVHHKSTLGGIGGVLYCIVE